ncbi:hypothetical protein [Glaciecola sp. SC05]|uniref:hypothetical protein n=1 Tax=Glaciecola sp. SC05 TaxID=1987355 RepID=UPI00352721D4
MAILNACSPVNNEHKITEDRSESALTISSSNTDTSPTQEFYNVVMKAAPFMPADMSEKHISCGNILTLNAQSDKYLTSLEANYSDYGWEGRIAHQPTFFKASSTEGRILVIDIAQKGDALAYRYLSNDNTYNELYEPWSSSKIFAFTGAIATLRKQDLGAQAKIGDTYVADMLTGINSYENFGTASGESNALATFFANIAGREYLTGLFYDNWLKLSTPNIYFRGAYGPEAFQPSSYQWQMLDNSRSKLITPFKAATDDPGYLSYRCENCGLNGNKPMTTLSQAEWLKRLAAHDRDAITRHPNLNQDDVSTLFYGSGHSYPDGRFAGMTLGISNMLQHAIANAINGKNVSDPKAFLDNLTDGKWRVFQKIGWGPSETRSTTENVVLAHVCLPHFQGGREFTVAAQVAVPEAKEENLSQTGEKMQALLQASLTQYFNEPTAK